MILADKSELGSQHPSFGGSQLTVTPDPGDQMSFPDSLGTCAHAHTPCPHTPQPHTNKHIAKI